MIHHRSGQVVWVLTCIGLVTVACGRTSTPAVELATASPVPTPPPATAVSLAEARCGDGVCDEAEQAGPDLCPQDCATPVPEARGRCGDGICDEVEQSSPDICPQDCPTPTSVPPQQPSAEPAGRCGDGICTLDESAGACLLDCALPEASADLPLYVTVYYHVEPNPQLFEAVEPGYFEAVSLSLRDMSASLASVDVRATFCFAWLYNDLAYCRNHDAQTSGILNSPDDTAIETYEHIVSDGHELAYHTHPPYAITEPQAVYYARPDATCREYDASDKHRWSGFGAGYYLAFKPGVYEFDDPDDPWYGQFIWERASESLFRIAEYLGVTVRHTNGGQKPLLDITNQYASGVNHEHSLEQLRSLIDTGFDLISPEVMPYFKPRYQASGDSWADPSTGYVAYLGQASNVQVYYPDLVGGHIEHTSRRSQGLAFMPVHRTGQAGWGKGSPDRRYYDPEPLGGTGGGGVRWRDNACYLEYPSQHFDPWAGALVETAMPSLADQFNAAMQRHVTESPRSVNAWGLNHHVVNVMWSDFSGLSDNWDQEIAFLRDIADGAADGVANEPRPDLVQFVTMQELSTVYDRLARDAGE